MLNLQKNSKLDEEYKYKLIIKNSEQKKQRILKKQLNYETR